MSDESDDWVTQTAATYRELQADADPGRPRLVAFLNVTTTARVRQVGLDRALADLQAVVHKAST